ncbi:MAG: hypothetical protein ACREYF_22475 [Gammaproteobacteria bacterium]
MVSVYALSQVQWISPDKPTDHPQGALQALVGESKNIYLRNTCDQPILVAINYSNQFHVRYTEGWWAVRPGNTVNTGLTTPTPDVFFFAFGQSSSWEWNGEGLSNGKQLSVVMFLDEKFVVKGGDTINRTNVH